MVSEREQMVYSCTQNRQWGKNVCLKLLLLLCLLHLTSIFIPKKKLLLILLHSILLNQIKFYPALFCVLFYLNADACRSKQPKR